MLCRIKIMIAACLLHCMRHSSCENKDNSLWRISLLIRIGPTVTEHQISNLTTAVAPDSVCALKGSAISLSSRNRERKGRHTLRKREISLTLKGRASRIPYRRQQVLWVRRSAGLGLECSPSSKYTGPIQPRRQSASPVMWIEQVSCGFCAKRAFSDVQPRTFLQVHIGGHVPETLAWNLPQAHHWHEYYSPYTSVQKL